MSSVFSSCAIYRPKIQVFVKMGKKCPINFIVDTGAEVSFISRTDFDAACFPGSCLEPVGDNFKNFDGSNIAVDGCMRVSVVCYNNKSGVGNFYVSNVPHSVLSIDLITSLNLTISCKSSGTAN